MKNMKGKEFDDHYKQMVIDDHQKGVAMFEDAPPKIAMMPM